MEKLNNPFEKCIFRMGYFCIVIPEKGQIMEKRRNHLKEIEALYDSINEAFLPIRD